MKKEDIIETLENLVRNSGIQLRYDKGDFVGGFCRLKEQKLIIINRKLSTDRKIEILAGETARLHLVGIEVHPKIREIIRKEAERQSEIPIEEVSPE